jgi:hypothetical protein
MYKATQGAGGPEAQADGAAAGSAATDDVTDVPYEEVK